MREKNQLYNPNSILFHVSAYKANVQIKEIALDKFKHWIAILANEHCDGREVNGTFEIIFVNIDRSPLSNVKRFLYSTSTDSITNQKNINDSKGLKDENGSKWAISLFSWIQSGLISLQMV